MLTALQVWQSSPDRVSTNLKPKSDVMLVQAGTSIFTLWRVMLLKKKESEKVRHAYGVKVDIWLGFMMANEWRDIPDLHALNCDWLTDHGKNTTGPAAKKRCSFEMSFMPQISWYTCMSLLYIFLIKIALSKMLSCCALKDLHRSYRETKCWAAVDYMISIDHTGRHSWIWILECFSGQ